MQHTCSVFLHIDKDDGLNAFNLTHDNTTPN